jgi:hypothetical protein
MSEDFPERASRIAETAELLRDAARAGNLFVTADGRVSECDLATLLGYSRTHLAQLRAEGRGPPSFNVGLAGQRRSYRLSAVAAWIEARANTDPSNNG